VNDTDPVRPKPAVELPGDSSPVEEYRLRLYVAGTSSRSRRAILRARELCAGELRGHSTLEVIDIYQDPIRARDDQIVATPTLVRETPLPIRRLIGTLAAVSSLLVERGAGAPGGFLP
jgi:circadian clock protein KaiB